MNKKISTQFALLFLVLATCLLLGACGNNKTPQTTEPAVTTQPTENTETVTTSAEVLPEDTTDTTGATAPSVEMGVGERGDYDKEDSGTQQTQPSDTTPVETKPVETTPEETKPVTTTPSGELDPDSVTMEMWDAMTNEEQDRFMASFPTLRDFTKWFNSAKAQQSTGDIITSDDDKIDLGELIKP